MTNDENNDGLDDRAAELERRRAELEAEQAQLQRELRAEDLTRQEQELEQQRQRIEAQRAELERQRAAQQHAKPAAPATTPITPAAGVPRVDLSAGAPAPTPIAAPAKPRRRWGIIAATGIVALLAGGAAGWFGYDVVNNDDEDTEGETVTTVAGADVDPLPLDQAEGEADPASDATEADSNADADPAEPEPDPEAQDPGVDAVATPEPDPTPPPEPTIASQTWAHPNGSVQADFPDGWPVGWDEDLLVDTVWTRNVMVGEPTRSDVNAENPYEAGTTFVGLYTGAGVTTVGLVDYFGPDGACNDAIGPEPFTFGDRTGQRYRYLDCGGVGGERWRVGFDLDTDTVLYATARSGTGGSVDDLMTLLLATVTTPTTDGMTPPHRECLRPPETSGDPEFPVVLTQVNLTDATIPPFAYIDSATGQPFPDQNHGEIDVQNYRWNPVNEGTIVRIAHPTGPIDYTVTAEPEQCVLITDAGIERG